MWRRFGAFKFSLAVNILVFCATFSKTIGRNFIPLSGHTELHVYTAPVTKQNLQKNIGTQAVIGCVVVASKSKGLQSF
jgi:hypothetical protein